MGIEQAPKQYTDLGNRMMDSSLGNPSFGPIVRQPIPTNPDTLTLLHWLFAAKSDIPLPVVLLDYQASAASGRLVIPASAGGGAVQRVWQVYPADKVLLYPSPYSPVIGGGGIEITEDDWEIVNGRTVIQKAGITDGRWKIVYTHGAGKDVVKRGDGYEAYPTWTKIPAGYAACAPDTFRWFDLTALRAIQLDTRAGKASQWTRLRDALRRTAVRGQDINDLRDVLVPLKGMGVFDLDGMFCWSDHPSAAPPPAPLNQGWSGYNFWTRDQANADIVGVVPGTGDTAYTVQIGRCVEDSWRAATSYQEPDQYLYVEIGAKLEADGSLPTGTATIFVSATRDYNESSRWAAAVDLSTGNLVETVNGVAIRGHLIPRASLLRVDGGGALPAGQVLLNFGLEFRLKGRYHVRLRKLRLLSGPSAAWVESNLEAAKRGSRLPYFPGAQPFALNGYTNTGNFVGYNGNPFHGYQLPDLWLNLEAEAALIHPGLGPLDLPIPNASGALTYPITPNNANSTPKTTNLLLAEQQVMFLRDAQARYAADLGITGPFAHTYVLNTSARLNIGNPTPHTWVYTGDDPNTQWAGYQVRPVESLCRLAYVAKDNAAAQDVRAMALSISHAWLDWLAGYWPNLDGMPWRGMPTDFPGDRPPETNYEEPHIVAIVLRALLWLRMAGDTDAARTALAVRCWHYLESMWVTEGRMANTWSPVPDQRQWYGFWHGEIMEAMAMIVKDAKNHLPEGISRDIALDRLTSTYNWLKQWGIREVT